MHRAARGSWAGGVSRDGCPVQELTLCQQHRAEPSLQARSALLCHTAGLAEASSSHRQLGYGACTRAVLGKHVLDYLSALAP